MKADGRPAEIVSATRAEANVAASVTCPPVNALPTDMMSGTMPGEEMV